MLGVQRFNDVSTLQKTSRDNRVENRRGRASFIVCRRIILAIQYFSFIFNTSLTSKSTPLHLTIILGSSTIIIVMAKCRPSWTPSQTLPLPIKLRSPDHHTQCLGEVASPRPEIAPVAVKNPKEITHNHATRDNAEGLAAIRPAPWFPEF